MLEVTKQSTKGAKISAANRKRWASDGARAQMSAIMSGRKRPRKDPFGVGGTKRRATCHPDRPHLARGLCRSCYESQMRKARPYPRPQRRNKAYHRRHALRKKYGLEIEQFEEMLRAQNGKCAICARPRQLVVDHDHSKPKGTAVRALLCDSCNKMLGEADDDPAILRAAALYLEKHA